MSIKVYGVYAIYATDVPMLKLINLYPSKDSAISAAKKIIDKPACCQVTVKEEEITESGRRTLPGELFSEKHSEKYQSR